MDKLDGMKTKVALIETRSPEILKDYRQKLEMKMRELLEDTQIEERTHCDRGYPVCR